MNTYFLREKDDYKYIIAPTFSFIFTRLILEETGGLNLIPDKFD